MRRPLAGENGAALVVAIMTTALMVALGSALVLTSVTETAISSNFREGVEALYAAEAGAGLALADLAAEADWAAVMGIHLNESLDRVLPQTGSRARIRVQIEPAEVPDAVDVTSTAEVAGRSRRTVRLTIARTDEVSSSPIRVLSWEEVP